MKAKRIQEGKTIDYTPEADLNAGDVVVLGDRCFFANLDVAAGTLGALATGGVFDVAKGGDAITLGAVLHWDAANSVATTSANDGATEPTAYPRLGIAILAAAAGDATVRVLASC